MKDPAFPEETRMRRVIAGHSFTYAPEHPYCAPDGWLLTARLVLEKKLRKILKPEEKVRHVDGDSMNDSPDNLELETK